MKTTTKIRFAAAPVYLGLLSVLGWFGIVFIASNPMEAWTGSIRMSWTSGAVVPFVLGNAAVAWGAAELSRRGELARSAAVGAVGTYGAFYVSALSLPPPGDELVSFSAAEFLVLVPWVGWAGLLAGMVIPLAWGRWEAARFEEEPAADA